MPPGVSTTEPTIPLLVGMLTIVAAFLIGARRFGETK